MRLAPGSQRPMGRLPAETRDLFDRLIRPEQQRLRDGKAEGLGRVMSDDVTATTENLKA
jgi:hypothetical protein